MLRAAVLLALVAFAVAQTSPFVNSNINTPGFSAAGDQVRFIPRGGRVLAVRALSAASLAVSGDDATSGAYRVLSVGAAAQSPRAPARPYYGNPGKERYQDLEGNGRAPAGHLIFSLDPTAGSRVIRDTRFTNQPREVDLTNFVAVPRFIRRERALQVNANDVLVTIEATQVQTQSFRAFRISNPQPNTQLFVIDPEDVVATYSAGLRLGGETYATNIGGFATGNQ